MAHGIIPGARRVTLQVDSLPMNARAAVERAGALGFDGVGANACRGAFTPENMGRTAVRDVKHLLARNGLCFSHLAVDTGKPLSSPGAMDETAERAIRITALARELDADMITLPVGILPDTGHDSWSELVHALNFLGIHAGTLDLKLAIETPPCKQAEFMSLLDGIESDSVEVCFSPGALLAANVDVAAAVAEMQNPPVIVIVRDVFMGADGMLQDSRFGEGALPWPEIMNALSGNGFRGYYAVRRTPAPDAETEVKKALEFVRTQGLLL